MGKLLRLTALLALLPVFLYAGAETGADILKEKTGVRAVALGGAYTAAANDIESINYNPAGLAFILKREAEVFSFPRSFADTTVIYAAFAQPFESPLLDGFVGLSAVCRVMPEIDNEDAEDAAVSYFDIAISGSYAASLYQFIKDDAWKSVNLGLSVKLVIEQLGIHSFTSIAFDAGAIYAFGDTGFKIGAALLNAGVPLSAKRGDTGPALFGSPLPMTLRTGAAYSLVIDKNNTTLFSADYIHDFYDAGQAAIGIEHSLINILFLRLGYNMPTDIRNPSALSAGTGIYITTTVPVELTVGFNYAYRLVMWNWFNSPDSTHAFSLALKF